MSEFLHLHVENALAFAEDLLPAVRAADARLRQVLDFCQHLRMAGIGFLFLSGTAGEFRRRLQQSGAAYAAYLEKVDDGRKGGAEALPFFDALAAGDLDAAGRIARAAARTWKQGAEYEEDFLFPEYLMQRFFLGASPESCAALLSRWEQTLQGSDDPRLGVCRSLQDGDAAAFDAGLTAFLGERQAFHERLARKELLSPAARCTEAKLSVEGLGLLCLAERAGIATGAEYPGAPSVARDRAPMALAADSWLHLG